MAGVLRQGIFGPGEAGARGFSTPRKRRKRRILSCARGAWAHLGTTTGSRLCPKDQPQQVRMPRVAELSENAWPRRAAAAGAPHTAAVRSRAFGGGIKKLVWTRCDWCSAHSRAPTTWGCSAVNGGGESLLYIRCLRRKPDLLVMDTILSLLNGDLSIWGVIAMPIGVAICFGPALAVWLKEEMRGGDGEKKEDHRKPIQKQ